MLSLGYDMSVYLHVHVSICSGLAAILNAKFLPAAITHVRQII